jgi:CBS domain-containing protein
MTKIAEVMTDRPRAITREASIRDAARLMDEEDVGSLPIVDEAARLVGIVTDRDIAIRAVGRGIDPDKPVVGMVSQADIARTSNEKSTGEVVEAISRPPRGPRVAGADVGAFERAERDPEYERDRRDQAPDR